LNDTCDVSTVTWTLTVKPILASNCLACHSAALAGGSGGGIRLENYTDVKTAVNNQKLYGSISHSSGYSPMPKGGSKLNSCNLQQIKKWIDNGAPEN
jgi:mono/diheme cytochrome c family protein